VALKFPRVHDFITELCWHPTEVLQSQEKKYSIQCKRQYPSHNNIRDLNVVAV